MFTNIFVIFWMSSLLTSTLYDVFQMAGWEREKIFSKYKRKVASLRNNASGREIRRFCEIASEDYKHKTFLCIDLGGTCLKLAIVEIRKLSGAKDYSSVITSQKFKYCNEIVKKDLQWYDWIAEGVQSFLSETDSMPRYGGLSFSYPLEQEDLKEANLMRFTKNYPFCRDIDEHKGLVEKLNQALSKLDIPVKINSITNDSTATFLATKMKNFDDSIAVLLGTGTNGAYEIKKGNKRILVNSEWGSFGEGIIDIQKWDRAIFNQLGNTSYNFLDVLIAGYKRKDIINNAISLLKAEESILQTSSELYVILENLFFQRTVAVLASLLVAVIEEAIESNKVHIMLNGSIFERPGIIKDLERELEWMCKRVHKDPMQVTIIFEKNATLLGIAYASFLISNGYY